MNIFTHWLAVARMCPACLSAWVLCRPSPLLPSVSFLLSSITHSFDIHPSSLAQYFRSEWLCHLFSLNLIPQLSILFCLNSIDTRWFRVYRGTHFGKCRRCKTHTVPLLLDLWFRRQVRGGKDDLQDALEVGHCSSHLTWAPEK